VPLDRSALAEEVLPLAVGLAAPAGAAVTLVHCFSWPEDFAHSLAYLEPFSGAELLGQDEQQAREYLSAVAARLARPGLTIETCLQNGPATEGILDCAAEQRADLIIMSTHGRGGFQRWFLGSVADRLLHSTTTPLLLVRADAQDG
jgi:nucleotide-binding universal stress UspA family protein